jgi:DnaK suppressor protein
VKQRENFIEKMKAQLLDKKEELSQQIKQLSQEKINDGQAKDSGDEASVVSMEKLQNSLQSNELGELNLIDAALARITLGEYGSCLDCGETISQQRLEYYPYAARCIVCQEVVEN